MGEIRRSARQFEAFCVLTLGVPGHMIRGFSSNGRAYLDLADAIAALEHLEPNPFCGV